MVSACGVARLHMHFLYIFESERSTDRDEGFLGAIFESKRSTDRDFGFLGVTAISSTHLTDFGLGSQLLANAFLDPTVSNRLTLWMSVSNLIITTRSESE